MKLVILLVLPLLLCGCQKEITPKVNHHSPFNDNYDVFVSSDEVKDFQYLQWKLNKIEKKIDEHDEFLKATVKRLEDQIH